MFYNIKQEQNPVLSRNTMKYELPKEFKKRWRRVRALQEKEARKLSIARKFQQLSSLVGLALGFKMVFKEDEGKTKARSRWILLKRYP